MTKFRPCIDIHNGKVKQIVGATLSDDDSLLKTNFESNKSPAYFAKMYQKDGLTGGHVIMLGKKNTEAAKESLKAYPGGLQVGGGINPDNAVEFLNAGASHVIVTSWIFPENQFDENRLKALTKKIESGKHDEKERTLVHHSAADFICPTGRQHWRRHYGRV